MMLFGLVDPGANAIVHAEFVAYGLAFRFILVRNGGINGRHDHVWHVFANFTREIEHALECGIAELAANEFMIFVGVGRIERNGDRVNDALELGRDISPVDEAALAVGVYSNRYIVAAFHLGCDLFERFECACGLAEPAENDFVVSAHVLFVEGCHDLFERRLVFEPQHVVGSFAVFAHTARALADAERARAAATIREVDVEPIVDGVDNGFGFLHDSFFRPCVCSRRGRLAEMPAAQPLALLAMRRRSFRFWKKSKTEDLRRAAPTRTTLLFPCRDGVVLAGERVQLLFECEAIGARNAQIDARLHAVMGKSRRFFD